MFLKSIEIRGFKSFANKTELTFKRGVTSIVGPNGSGKSNISDAVRWVLGEQSVKSLRGGKMEDVIFAGTQFRKPVSLAQVSLTLDNTKLELPIEYTDVTVSRRIYRSGDSEYYINNTQCRLKDIQELFMDTGIGKEGYSIIGQGKIDAILSGKTEERRNLLEEAAGIVKFKTRKQEAEKKLQNSESNLTRISDILNTYEERLEPLRVDSEKAKKFLRLSEELKLKEVNIIVHSIEKLNTDIDEISNKIKDIKNDLNILHKENDNCKKELDIWNEELKKFENENLEERKAYYSKKEELGNTVSENNILLERIANLENITMSSTKDLEEIDKKIDELHKSRNLSEKQLNDISIKSKELNKYVLEKENLVLRLNSQLESEEKVLNKIKEDHIDYLGKVSSITNNIVLINNNIEGLNKKLTQLKTSCESFINSIQINNNTKEMLSAEINKLKGKINTYEENMKSNKKEISSHRDKLSIKEKGTRELHSIYNKLEANHNFLLNLDKQYEGYSKSIKNLMQAIDKQRVPEAINNAFVLGEIIEVDKLYEKAIEIALGGAISHVITSNEEVAKTLIKYLKQNNLGRGTFLPLNIIKGKRVLLNKDIKNMNGYIGIASELIKYNNKFTPAIDYVLGKTIICDNMDNALILAKRCDYSYKIVTLSGEVINPGGSLTGGSIYSNKNTSVIGRKREIEEIDNSIRETSLKIDKYSNEVNNLNEIVKKLDEENLNLKDQVYYENIEITKLQEKLSHIDNETVRLKNNLNISKNEITSIELDMQENIKEKDINEAKVNELEKLQTNNVTKISDIEKTISFKQDELEKIKETLMTKKIEKAQIDEMYLNNLKEAERIDKEISEFKERKDNLRISMENSANNIHEFRIKIKNNDRKIELTNGAIRNLDIKFKDREIELIKVKEKINLYQAQLEEFHILKEKKDSEFHKYEVILTKLQTEEQSLKNKLYEEHEIDSYKTLDFKIEIEDINKYKQEISNIKISISNLGVVNVGAIEEYKEIGEKFNFMNGQKEDLIKAKDELMNVIGEMTEKMKVVFNENFHMLRTIFNETFNELFKGGSADLILTGDELTGNIDINVQPPGKKLQNINLMSGGEKVLSAIALLFAILKMKPTPFCILDEIEAALDDANVARYAEFLKKFSENIQFIVITHRKGTMESSDVLYGVTMEEKGVSKIVSVDLTT
ncbi:MAG: chromosome segregation protein SMC [Clostridium lundense]|nr:chromosome segregation protein SMC [Clostridium lundense]